MGSLIVKNLGKAYKVYPSKFERLKEWLIPFSKPRHQHHWVLQDLNFEVKPGEAVGIVGINGAGKSTLLKMITGTTQPTTGSVDISGRVAALLELGMGFHPDFTGRQNVLMAGQLLGYSKAEIEGLMPEIESFAEIGEYIDLPVRVYSSGMQVRLAFAVATAKRPDILIVDEALSVGDVFFQQKCFERIKNFIANGTTLLFVSHSFEIVYALCDRAILLENGIVTRDAEPKKVIDYFQSQLLVEQSKKQVVQKESQNLLEMNTNLALNEHGTFESNVKVTEAKIYVDKKETTVLVARDRGCLSFSVSFDEDVAEPHVGFQIRNARGEPIFMTNTCLLQAEICSASKGDMITVSFSFDCLMSPGEYTVTVGVADRSVFDIGFTRQLARVQNICAFTVIPLSDHYKWSGQCDLNVAVAVK